MERHARPPRQWVRWAYDRVQYTYNRQGERTAKTDQNGTVHEYTYDGRGRQKWRGYLWQGRFGSFVMDEPYLAAAARYVELNPARANLVADAADWPWSSAEAHLSACDDRLVQVAPLLGSIDDWRAFLDSAIPEDQLRRMRNYGRTGRPLGDASFLERLESLVGRVLRPQKPGRKPRFAK